MEVKILNEAGYEYALLGIGKSFGVKEFDRLEEIAKRLAPRDGGHNKFLESIVVWIDIKASRYWWAEADTYRVGTTKQSESTIHTITKKPLTQSDFEHPILEDTLEYVNGLIDIYNKEGANTPKRRNVFTLIKANLPEGYLQSRILCTNYKVLKNMFAQRKHHVLNEWHYFIDRVLQGVQHPEFLSSVLERKDG